MSCVVVWLARLVCSVLVIEKWLDLCCFFLFEMLEDQYCTAFYQNRNCWKSDPWSVIVFNLVTAPEIVEILNTQFCVVVVFFSLFYRFFAILKLYFEYKAKILRNRKKNFLNNWVNGNKYHVRGVWFVAKQVFISRFRESKKCQSSRPSSHVAFNRYKYQNGNFGKLQ